MKKFPEPGFYREYYEDDGEPVSGRYYYFSGSTKNNYWFEEETTDNEWWLLRWVAVPSIEKIHKYYELLDKNPTKIKLTVKL